MTKFITHFFALTVQQPKASTMLRMFFLTVGSMLMCCAPAIAGETATFKNGQGTHVLTITNGEVMHALNSTPPGSINEETAKAADGNRLTGVVAVSGTGFTDLADVHVVAVDKHGGIWHTIRLADGTWTRWGSINDEVNYTVQAVGINCSSSGRKLTLVVSDASGAQKTITRDADGTWSK